jgi:hypothetical protein
MRRNGEAMTIFKVNLTKMLTRKGKNQPEKKPTSIDDKLKRQERLTEDEFWTVYASIHKEGPQVKFQNPDNWIIHRE